MRRPMNSSRPRLRQGRPGWVGQERSRRGCVAPSGGGELGAGVGATPFGLLVEGSRYLYFAGSAVGEASRSGRSRVVVRGGGFFPFRVWWTGWAGLGCVVSGELRAGG